MKYLVAVDGSALALQALAHVLQLAREGLPVELVLANVQEPASLYEVVVAHDPDVLARLAIEAATHALDAAEAVVRAAGLPCQREVAVGQPATMLVELAEDHGCDGIVLGARGVGGVRAALLGAPLGSVSHAVLMHATQPVTVVRPPPEPEAADDAA